MHWKGQSWYKQSPWRRQHPIRTQLQEAQPVNSFENYIQRYTRQYDQLLGLKRIMAPF
jgi:hypothetical protein